MGLSDSDEIHPVLGNVKQALEALVQQRLEFQIGWIFHNVSFNRSLMMLLNKAESRIYPLAFIYRYLQKDKVNGPEGNTLFYELAERALDEPVNGRIKEYVSQVL